MIIRCTRCGSLWMASAKALRYAEKYVCVSCRREQQRVAQRQAALRADVAARQAAYHTKRALRRGGGKTKKLRRG